MILNSEQPIGFMDSGLGGISVLREAVRLMPEEDFIYIGDSAHAPYGTRPREEIRALTYAVVEQLLDRGIKGLAVACNTATGAAVASLRQRYPQLPLVGIEPAIKPAVESGEGGRILVMATPMTIRQEKFGRLLARYQDQAEIIPIPCEGLMEFVEAGTLKGEQLDAYLERVVGPYLNDRTESIVLGCTHYPFLRRELRAFLKDRKVALIDGSFGTARELKRRLSVAGLLRNGHKGTVTIENTSEDPELIRRSYELLNMDLD